MSATVRHLKELRDKDRALLKDLTAQRVKTVSQFEKEIQKIDEIITKVTSTQEAWSELIRKLENES